MMPRKKKPAPTPAQARRLQQAREFNEARRVQLIADTKPYESAIKARRAVDAAFDEAKRNAAETIEGFNGDAGSPAAASAPDAGPHPDMDSVHAERAERRSS